MINIKNLDKDNVVPIVWVDNTEELNRQSSRGCHIATCRLLHFNIFPFYLKYIINFHRGVAR